MKPDLNWEKSGGLIPAVVQDAKTGAVLMLGFMNQEAFAVTMATHQVTFFPGRASDFGQRGKIPGDFWML
ncbi:hypothetical protein E3A20_03290 [Planctomyces bekefii]|uniref:Phosphoribosyl-AMP cyclohydrolase n=1 Tax=Planctomyces bekefii TaxID=1653850 RepID=A0A5C6MCT6_9PLAN|nr:hypothetical protein E3A20_03290 [Planctomyces bekefii]